MTLLIPWGAAYDTKRERLMISGGGYHDCWGNDIFAFDINALSWLWLYPHSDCIPFSDFLKVNILNDRIPLQVKQE